MENSVDKNLKELSVEEILSNLVGELKIELPNIKEEDIKDIINSMGKCYESKKGSEYGLCKCSKCGLDYNNFIKNYRRLTNPEDAYYFGMGTEPHYEEIPIYSHKNPVLNDISKDDIISYLDVLSIGNKNYLIERFSHLLYLNEKILELNPDSIYGVYNLEEEDINGYKLDFLENVMACYPNQYDNLKGKDFIHPDITILDIGDLRKGKIKVLHGDENIEIKNPVLLSNGIVEYIESEYIDNISKKKKSRKHIITTLRDGGASDKQQRTTIAGRNSGGDLYENLEQEHIGEAPFLGKNLKGEYVLCISDNSIDKINFLEEGIVKFLEEKYKKPRNARIKKYEKKFLETFNPDEIAIIEKFNIFKDKNINTYNERHNNVLDKQLIEVYRELLLYNNTKTLFEKSFPGIKYEQLEEILKDIVENKRYLKYETKTGNIDGLDHDMKNIKMGDKEGQFFVYHDKDNNTIEYRKVLEITKTPEDFIPISRRPGRLYLESENQYPRNPRISNANSIHKLVPTVKYLCEKSIEA